MINRRQLAPLFFALCLAAAPLLAQPATGDGEGASSATAASGSAASPATTQQAPAPSEPAAKSSSSGTSSNSPFDYRSSEQISEDVPVSFPVDI